ncbi:unnamed protein product, partial [Rotaria sordida]
ISSYHCLIALIDQCHSIKTENKYLNYSTNFLLERTTHTPDYNRFIFENPLDKYNTTTYNRLKQTNTFPLPTLSTQTKRTSLTINVDNRNK